MKKIVILFSTLLILLSFSQCKKNDDDNITLYEFLMKYDWKTNYEGFTFYMHLSGSTGYLSFEEGKVYFE